MSCNDEYFRDWAHYARLALAVLPEVLHKPFYEWLKACPDRLRIYERDYQSAVRMFLVSRDERERYLLNAARDDRQRDADAFARVLQALKDELSAAHKDKQGIFEHYEELEKQGRELGELHRRLTVIRALA